MKIEVGKCGIEPWRFGVESGVDMVCGVCVESERKGSLLSCLVEVTASRYSCDAVTRIFHGSLV